MWFPSPHLGEDNGLVAVGGDLSVERLLLAYSNGFFPWYAFNMESEPHWYCPLDRYVIFPSEIHISHTMRQLMRQRKYEVTFNQDFEGVIRGCSTAQGRDEEGGAWLGPDIIEAYTRMHRLDYAASVEVWEKSSPNDQTTNLPNDQTTKRLVGGLYGIMLKKAFFGESMFSLVPNASKLALIYLAKALEAIDGLFIDCQFETPHLASMGGRHITYEQYMELLRQS